MIFESLSYIEIVGRQSNQKIREKSIGTLCFQTRKRGKSDSFGNLPRSIINSPEGKVEWGWENFESKYQWLLSNSEGKRYPIPPPSPPSCIYRGKVGKEKWGLKGRTIRNWSWTTLQEKRDPMLNTGVAVGELNVMLPWNSRAVSFSCNSLEDRLRFNLNL